MAYQNEPEEEEKNLKEPQGAYYTPKKERIRFSSFQQQEDEMVAYWASITPLQRLKHLHEMVIASFGLTNEQLKNPNLSHSIKIIYYQP